MTLATSAVESDKSGDRSVPSNGADGPIERSSTEKSRGRALEFAPTVMNGGAGQAGQASDAAIFVTTPPSGTTSATSMLALKAKAMADLSDVSMDDTEEMIGNIGRDVTEVVKSSPSECQVRNFDHLFNFLGGSNIIV